MSVDITYDEDLIFEIAAKFDLRDPNRLALQAVVHARKDVTRYIEFRYNAQRLHSALGYKPRKRSTTST